MGRVGIALGVIAALGVPASARESHAFAGEGGFSGSFAVIGGNYEIYVYAKYPSRSTYAGQSKTCVFGGDLQRIGANENVLSFGNGVTVGPVVGYKLGPQPLSLQPGTYRVHVAVPTNCLWHATIQSADDNGPGLAPVRLELKDSDEEVTSVTLRDKVQFLAQYRTDHLREVPVSGRLELVHGGRVMQTYPLKLGSETESLAAVAYQQLQWDPGDVALLGKNTARFVLVIDGREFTSAVDFVLTQ